MLRLLVFLHKLFKSRKKTNDPAPDKSITIGRTLMSGIAIALVATIFYLIANGADLLAAGLVVILFAGFYFFWDLGGKVTVRVDKGLKAEPKAENTEEKENEDAE